MSLARLKAAILRRADLPENGGTIDPCDSGYSNGDRYGRLSPGVLKRNARIMKAIHSLEKDGLIEHHPMGFLHLWMRCKPLDKKIPS